MDDLAEPSPKPKDKQRPTQFGLKKLLLVILLISIPFSIVSHLRYQNSQCLTAISSLDHHLRKKHGSATIRFFRSPNPGERLLDQLLNRQVNILTISLSEDSIATLRERQGDLVKMNNLTQVNVYCGNQPVDLAALALMPHLDSLKVDSLPIIQFDQLLKFKNLRQLELVDSQIIFPDQRERYRKNLLPMLDDMRRKLPNCQISFDTGDTIY